MGESPNTPQVSAAPGEVGPVIDTRITHIGMLWQNASITILLGEHSNTAYTRTHNGPNSRAKS